ncbi:MAG: hypothetical protein HUN04_17395 [Desulfobacter sp.]|nr:MAG: hypothetical protein HUN04_17395 [Desulfobacter sp.]
MRPLPHRNGKRAELAALLAAVLLLLTLAGCGGGMSDAVKEDSKAVEKRLKTTEKFIQTQKEKFDRLVSSADFKPMAGYAAKENWAGGFGRAKVILSRARGLFDSELAPIMKKNDPQGEVQARVQINRINKVLQEAKDQADSPFARMDRIRAAMDGPQSFYVSGGDAGRSILEKIKTLDEGPVAEARKKFPDNLSKIDHRFAPFSKIQSNTRARLDTLEKEYQNFTAAKPVDYAAFIDSADGIEKDRKDLDTLVPKMKEDLDQLYQSYTKVLQDMKVDYYVTVKRESWNENSDNYRPGFATFRRQVTPAVFQTLTESNLENIAELIPVYGRVSLKNHIGNAWTALNINPTENWPGHMNHNAASFWIEKADAEYFHKYVQESNGETAETDWVKVNPSFFDQNLDNLGMAVLSKPYGEFEPDTQAAPPGMAYVGNPAYGEWKKDENGENFWSWYGRYAFFSNLFFFPPYYYHYGSWNRWHTGYRYKKPYYGKNKSGKPIFGTRGTKIKKTPRYQNTTFARTGGFKSGPASVRGASLRGGGPKGKGK